MKYLLLGFVLMLSVNVGAQTDSIKQTESYIQFKAKRTTTSGNLRISIDFGKKYLDKDSLVRERMVAKIESFNKTEDVLEYLNAHGWILTTAYATTYEYFYTYYYIMRKVN